MDDTETRRLVEDAQKGDRGAFAALVERYQRLALAYAGSLLGDEARAEDAAQDAFLAAYEKLSTLRDADVERQVVARVMSSRRLEKSK